MRVKIECGPPLPSVKAWFIVPPVSTVWELKETLCGELPALNVRQTAPSSIALYLDGFELLDATSIDVVRDGDSITIKHHATLSGKRKPDNDDESPVRKRPKRVVVDTSTSKSPSAAKSALRSSSDLTKPSNLLRSLSESSSDASTSDSSSETSESSATSDSDSDADSSESSSSNGSSSSSAPSVRPSSGAMAARVAAKSTQSTKATAASGKQVAKSLVEDFVPPGHGKSTTHSRNLRRRRKKQYDRMAAQAEPVNVNDVPLGVKGSVSQSRELEASPSSAPIQAPTTQTTIMMASLSNKNKRKGFKQAMAGKIPKKIIFSAEDAEDESTEASRQEALPFTTADRTDISTTAPNLFPRLVPPSELQEQGLLPPNMFVTSIDVEEGMHTSRRQKKSKSRQAEPEADYDAMQVEEQVVLDYGEAEDTLTTQRESQRDVASTQEVEDKRRIEVHAPDWAAVEGRWALLSKVTSESQVHPDLVLGWKALAINPTTFTPEILLNVGRVIACEGKLELQPLYRPGGAEVSFGGHQDGDEENVPMDPESYDWADVFTGDWRIVS